MRPLTLAFALSSLLLATACPGPTQCTAGADGCACIAGATCNAGLQCGADLKCVPAVSAGVQFPAEARGCELLLTETAGTQVVSAEFKSGVKGTWLRQAPKVAVTVVAAGDSSLAGAVQLSLSGPASALTLSKASCVDVRGQALSTGPSLR